MLITANQPFGEWGKIFPDQAMTLAAIDRLSDFPMLDVGVAGGGRGAWAYWAGELALGA